MATAPILRYALTTEPFPLQASPQSGNLTTATLTVVASNPTPNPVTLQGLIVTLPIGDDSTDLTPDAASISPIPPANWTLEPNPQGGKFVFHPNTGHGAVGSEGLDFVFNDVEINRQTGTVAVEIMEGSNNCTPPNCPTKTLDLTKFPNGWGEVSFSAEHTSIPYDTSPTLYWNGPQGATYTIDYYTQQTGVVTVPSTGQPPLSNSGQYPGTNAPPLRLEQTTTFTLNVEERIDNQPYQAQQQVTVTVEVPAPKIISFTAKPKKIQNGPNTVKLEWATRNTSKVVISGVTGYGVPSNDLAIDSEHTYVNDQASKGTLNVYPTESTLYTATAYGLNKRQSATASFQVISPPKILTFTGEIQTADGAEISLILNWDVHSVTECEISGIPEKTVKPSGSKTITPSAKFPLQTAYTLTAANPAGKVSAQLTVIWGKQAPTTTKVEQPNGIAVSPDGTLVFVANQGKNGVSVLDATTLQPVGEPFVSSNPIIWKGSSYPAKGQLGVAVSSHAPPPYGSRVFVTNYTSKSLSVLLTAQTDPPKIRQYANATAVGKNPMGVAVSPDGLRVFVTNFSDNTLSVLDVEKLLPVEGTPLPVGKDPASVAVLPDGSRVFVTNFLGNTVSVFDATADPIKVMGTPIPVGKGPLGLAVLPDGSRVFVANTGDNTVSVLDATADPIKVMGTPIPVGFNPLGLTVSPDGKRVFVANSTDNTVSVLAVTPDSVKVIGKPIPVGSGPQFLATSPNGTPVFVSNFPGGGPSEGIISVVVPTSLTGGIGN